MKKEFNLLRIRILLCSVLAILLLSPTILNAQRTDAFISNYDEYEDNFRDIASYTWTFSNDAFGTQPAPIGNGLLIMLTAGAGYAVVRRKRSRRDTSHLSNGMMLLIALVLMLGTTQCKKRIETVTHNSDNTIQITLRTSYDAKHYINLDQQLGFSPVSFTLNDVIYVGDGTSCIGQLTYGDSGFAGSITTPSSSTTYLYFYYVGNRNPIWNGNNSAFTIDISDQSNDNVNINNTKYLPVLSCGRVKYDPYVTDYHCELHNQCVLVRFEIESTEGITDTYRISNMLSEARVDFTNNSEPEIVPTGVVDAITLYCGPHNQINNYTQQSEMQLSYKYRWAILLKTPEKRHTYAIKAEDQNLRTYYDMGYVGPFNPGDPAGNYIYDQYTINNGAGNITTDKLFIVSNNGNVVQFAPGNLQYKAFPNPTWRFAENPWDYVGNASKGTVYETIGGVLTKCNNAYIDETYEGWIDLFGWGCTSKQDSVYHALQNNHYPYSREMSKSNDAINKSYGPTGVHNLRTSKSLDWGSDWGSVQISNTTQSGWRTLTFKEWTALRNNWNTEHRGLAQIKEGDEVISQGVILLPLNYSGASINTGSSAWNSNIYTKEEWGGMAANGAVFIPYSFYRYTSTGANLSLSNRGYYWVSSCKTDWSSGYASMVNGSNFITTVEDGMPRSFGLSVRLVR